MKTKVILLSLVVATSLFAGCAAKETAKTDTKAPAQTETKTEDKADATTGASNAVDEAAFLKGIGKDGAWLVYTTKDMAIDKELVLEGDFKNDDKAARKLALYTQDADHNVTARFKLTAPKLTVKSENARIQGGTFVGDVYVEAKGFYVADGTIEGNLYFASEELKASYEEAMKAQKKPGTVTGKVEVAAAADATTGASNAVDEAAFLKGISKDGAWLVYTTKDLAINQDLVLEGDFKNDDVPARKLALYTQDENRTVTARFKLTAPKLTVKSENARIQGGTFVGDVYVEAKGFYVADGNIEGNLYFASEDLKASYEEAMKAQKKPGKVTGAVEVKAAN
jgi:uncharacterized protein (DUF2141 family)